MKKLRPMTWRDELLAGEFLFETLLALAAVGLGFAQGYKSFYENPPQTELGYVFIGLSFLTAGVLMCRAIGRKRKALHSGSPHSLDSVLYSLREMLLMLAQRGEEAGLRLCVFVPSNKANHVHQISNYVGVDSPYGCGRDMLASCGVVGLAFRSGDAQYDSLPEGEHIINYLVETYGFDVTEASQMQQDRRSWAAVPVGGPGEVIAAIFLDCRVEGFFGEKNCQTRRLLEAATFGVARFLAAD